ncbi:hypothetical protein XH93_07265 [Bradyrhizobium sp. CCBAU 51753]|nr:hypothetical protein XH93_07265 [Bradyrhizobium sp. CCBAU 51753]
MGEVGLHRRCNPGEGYLSASPSLSRSALAERYPSSGASRHLLPQGEKGRGRHCEERSDEAIHGAAFAERWIASLRSQ